MWNKVKALGAKLFPSQERLEHAYLCESVDLVDLENRMRQIQKGYFRQNWPLAGGWDHA